MVGVVVVLGVVAAAEADVFAAVDVETEDCPETVDAEVDVVEGVVVVVEPDGVAVATDEEWAVVPEATSTPRPTAPADAATPMPMVARRTRTIARSRERAAEWELGLCCRDCRAMAGLSGSGR